MDREFLLQALTNFGIKKSFHVELLEKYYERVIDVNKVMNLTSITDEKEFIIKHICDSASPLLIMDIKGKKCIDIGTGAGFPGIPLKILEPVATMDYAESIGKKANFVKETIEMLGLEGRVFGKRAEDIGRDISLRESYDIVFTRAVSSLNLLMEYCIPLLRIGGILVSYKGRDPEEEIANAKNALKIFSCSIKDIYEYVLPDSDIKHTLVIIEKNNKTPDKYPRPTAKIVKNPL
ncbi:MAG: 16S rRNA (guanine(527)-N(7))-methyltransferase RsmG [Thermoanaerobacteraceae bacterium]|nr:16S rRNA (guanine(527)-N(7))-methyltransferase RsmG [Thermoanaerobacteraceae bacterium]